MPDLFKQWLVEIPKADFRLLSMIGVGVHWWILQYTIGLSMIAIIFEIVGRRFNNETLLEMSRTYSKILAVIFATGAITGTLVEFGLVLLWPNLIELVGLYFFFPLYLEIFAFLAEAVFIYMYFYTWDKVKPAFHTLIGIFAAAGATISALMIVSVNTLMSIPPGLVPGYDPKTGVWREPSFNLILPDGTAVTLTSSQVRDVMLNDPETFHAVLFATVKKIGVMGIVFSVPGAFISFLHAIFASYSTAAFTILGVYAYRYLTARNDDERNYYYIGLRYISVLALIFIVLQGIIGDQLGKVIAKYNPEKLAAMEGTSSQILSIPKLLGLEWLVKLLAYGDPGAHLPNYDAIPAEWRPPIFIHYVYYTKMLLAILLGIDAIILVAYWYVLKKDVPRFILRLNILAPIIVQIVSTFGWGVREVGRKPWTVYGILKVEEAATPNTLPLAITAGAAIFVLLIGAALLYVIWHVFRRR